MGIKYQTCNRLPECITVLKIQNETETFLWVDERLYRKQSEVMQFHDTWEEAHKYLIQNAERSVIDLENSLDAAIAKLERINNLKPLESSL